MKAYETGSIRNVAVVGHSGAGKTQLIAALLFTAGATPRLGRVDDGTTVTDYDDEEVARKHTLSAALAWAEWNKTKINFIDTPGIGNFLSDARAALRVADAALVAVDAVAGVEVQTEKVWAEAESVSLPRIVVVNRLDRERASLDAGTERHEQGGRLELAPGEPLRLHIFLDHSAIEIFANDRAVLTSRIYPTRDDSLGIAAFAEGGAATLRTLDVWEMARI